MAALDIAALRSKLLVARDRLDTPGHQGPVRVLLTEVIDALHADPTVDVPSLPEGPIKIALGQFMQTLLMNGFTHPQVLLIVETHDDHGENLGRTLAATFGNPVDILRLALRNLTEGQ